MNDFFQQAPELANTYETNPWLNPYLRWKLPEKVRTAWH
jgi:hypothetical protein